MDYGSLFSMAGGPANQMLSPEMIEYLKKLKESNPQAAGADKSVPDANNQGAGSVINGIASSIGQSGGNYGTDASGVTDVTSSGDIAGGALQKGLKAGMATGNPLVGAGIAALSFVGGKVQQGTERRRAMRDEGNLAADFERAQQASSVYADPNSVYYSAENGAPIDPKKERQQLATKLRRELATQLRRDRREAYFEDPNVDFGRKLGRVGDAILTAPKLGVKSMLDPDFRARNTGKRWDDWHQADLIMSAGPIPPGSARALNTNLVDLMSGRMDGGKIGRIPKKPC